MPVWNVSSDPKVVLRSWRVYELEDGDRHLVGYNDKAGEGRVSSKILSFDKENRSFTTRSRKYYIEGESGYSIFSDASYTWAHWKKLNSITEVKEVSNEYE